jgi:hypothetical protein
MHPHASKLDTDAGMSGYAWGCEYMTPNKNLMRQYAKTCKRTLRLRLRELSYSGSLAIATRPPPKNCIERQSNFVYISLSIFFVVVNYFSFFFRLAQERVRLG